MKLTDHRAPGLIVVTSYTHGALRIGEETLTHSCLLRADQLIRDWRPRSMGELALTDLEPILALTPEIVLLGSGSRQRFPAAAWLAGLLSRGVGCEVMTTEAACRTYNVLVSEERRVVAALLLGDD